MPSALPKADTTSPSFQILEEIPKGMRRGFIIFKENRVLGFAALVVWASLWAAMAPAHEVPAEMATAAHQFLKSLSPEDLQRVVIDFDDPHRQKWHFFPSTLMEKYGGRRGLELKEMTSQQRALAHGLLNTALSHRGYQQAMTVIALEKILYDLEQENPMRDSGKYHVAIHGEPSADQTWGWSFEGHHLSINVTLVDGKRLCVTPSFFGSNPAIVPSGTFKGLDTLQKEQSLARKLVQSLGREQRQMAVIAEKAPPEILTKAEIRVSADQFQPPKGIPYAKLSPSQQAMLLELVDQFLQKYREPIVGEIQRRTPITDGDGVFFAWAGGIEPGEGHYYRVQTPFFLFEYDNTQNDANHVHAVWRQFEGDFGEDLLGHHYRTSPHHAQK